RRAYSISPLASLRCRCWFGALTVATALAASGHGGHSGSGGPGAHSAGGGSRGIGSNRGHARTTIASAARFGGNAPIQRSGIQVCPIPPIGCLPRPGVNGCRRYCPGHGGYFFGHYAYFDDYWFGQYYYRDTYAAAYQPQIAPDSY